MQQYELPDLNPLLSDRVRLLVMALLAASRDSIDFTQLIEKLSLTRGNLSSHMRRLEEAGLVEVRKEFVGRRPRTSYRCTNVGRREIRAYLKSVESLLRG